MHKKVYGFIGLGNMGFHMANSLIRNGKHLVVYDINETVMDKLDQECITRATSPKDVADKAEVILVSLPTPRVVKSVALNENGIIFGEKVKAYIDLSSSGIEVSEEVCKEFYKRDIKVLDAPVSGGVIGALNATLSIMVAGKYDDFLEHQSILNLIGRKVFFIGDKVGQAQVMKVINNLLSSSALAMTSEAMVLGVKAGLDPQIMIDVLNASSGRNSATEDKFNKSILNRKFDYGFKATLAYKDMKLCTDLAEKLGVPMFLGNNMVNFWKFIVSQGDPDQDYTKVIQYIEEWAGVEVGKDLDKVEIKNVNIEV